MRRLRRQDRREIPPTRTRQILAPRLPEMHMLRAGPSGHGQILLLQRWHDPMQKRLHKVTTVFDCSLLDTVCLILFQNRLLMKTWLLLFKKHYLLPIFEEGKLD